MQVSVETGEGLERRLLVDLPASQVDEIVDKKLNELSKSVRLDGFRPGKVPVRVIKQRFGGQVRQEAYGELIQASYYEAVTEQKLMPAGDPKIEMRENAENEGGFSYTAVIEVMPTVELADLSDATISRPQASVEDSDVDEMIEKLRTQRMVWTDVERAAQDGDTVTMNFKGMIDGELFEGGSADAVPLVLGSNSMIDGFESGLLGAAAGDERTLELKFPEDYRAEQFAGKDVVFDVTVVKVAEGTLPEIDNDFVKAFGLEEGGEAELRAEVSKNMEQELSQKIKGKTKDQVMDVLRDNNPMDIPAAMVAQESEAMKQQAMQDMQQNGQQSTFDLPASIFEEQAKKRVHLGLLVAQIIDTEKMDANDDELRSTIEEMANSYEKPEDVVKYYMDNEQQKASIKNLVLENKVVDWVMEQTKVEEDVTTFAALMNEPQPQA